jgi:AraC-like DNA-binding protein
VNVRTTATTVGLELRPDDRIRLTRVNGGHQRVTSENETLEYSAGDTYIQAATNLSYHVPLYHECSQIAIPRARLRQLGLPEQALHSRGDLAVRGGVVDMIFDLFHSFALRVRNGPSLSSRAVTSVRDSIVGMAAAAFEESMAAETAPLSRVKEYIDDHVHDPGLSVATAAAGLHVSERTLYRLFAGEDQTVASYIRSARLRRVKRDLDAAEGAGSIRDIAVRWGFTDSGHFAKLFQQEFGLLPSEYVSRR